MDGNQGSIDLGSVKNLAVIDEVEVHNDSIENTPPLNSSESEDIFEISHDVFADAKQTELQSWINNKVYDVVPCNGQKCVSVRWVCTINFLKMSINPKPRA